MWFAEGPPPPRQPDEERLAEFGSPVFGFLPQPRLRERGWSFAGSDGVTTRVAVHNWLADIAGDFHFVQYPVGPIGTELRGYVHTEVPRPSDGDGASMRDTLDEHLNNAVTNYLINQPGYEPALASDEWQTEGRRLWEEVRARPDVDAEIVVDGVAYPAVRARYEGFTATTARVDSRVVTVVLHDEDASAIDSRLTRRL
jgi:hypothetical protein